MQLRAGGRGYNRERMGRGPGLGRRPVMGAGKGEVEESESAGVEVHVRKQGMKREYQADIVGTAALLHPPASPGPFQTPQNEA